MIEKLRSASYEEFQASFALDIPAKYNFAFDMVDATAAADPDRLAMVHVDDADVRRLLRLAFPRLRGRTR